jgi:catechol 2,3-dioxygenase-like lactoylglutathione lyase family enzyme
VEIDHVTVPIRDYVASKTFYERVLHPLGFSVRLDWPDKRRAFLGTEGMPSSLWLTESNSAGSLELSLAASAQEAVDAFHAAAVSAGASTEYEPSVRAEQSRRYYAARVLDPDGNSLEVVYRGAVAAQGQLAA